MAKNNLIYNVCPVCRSKMTSNWHRQSRVWSGGKIDYVYTCIINPQDHFCSQKSYDDLEVVEMQSNLYDKEVDQKYFIKIDFVKNTTDMWLRDELSPRHTFNKVIMPNFSNPESVKLKIKTYLTFL